MSRTWGTVITELPSEFGKPVGKTQVVTTPSAKPIPNSLVVRGGQLAFDVGPTWIWEGAVPREVVVVEAGKPTNGGLAGSFERGNKQYEVYMM